MAEVARRVPPGRLRNRRRALELALAEATTGRQVLAAAAQYFRSTFILADPETIERVSRQLIEMTDREAGEQP